MWINESAQAFGVQQRCTHQILGLVDPALGLIWRDFIFYLFSSVTEEICENRSLYSFCQKQIMEISPIKFTYVQNDQYK